jgi:hypothetical protein
MSARTSGALVVVLALILVSARGSFTRAQGPGPSEAAAVQRERSGSPGAPDAPTISFIDSPTPTCYRSEVQSTTCLVNWGHLQVSAVSPQTVVSMTVSIDDQVRANYQGYFQSTMVVSAGFHGDGLQVTCGPPGVDGVRGMGRVHNWTVRARDSEGLEAVNRGTVLCPASPYRVFLELVLRNW